MSHYSTTKFVCEEALLPWETEKKLRKTARISGTAKKFLCTLWGKNSREKPEHFRGFWHRNGKYKFYS